MYSKKIFWSFATSGITGVLINSWKNILKLWRICRASRKIFCNFRKYWSLYKCLKNILKLWEFFRALEFLEKCLASSGSTGAFVNTWKILWSFVDFEGLLEILEKFLATSGSTGVFVNTLKNILKLLGLCTGCMTRNDWLVFCDFLSIENS